jgi:hypothetical protein
MGHPAAAAAATGTQTPDPAKTVDPPQTADTLYQDFELLAGEWRRHPLSPHINASGLSGGMLTGRRSVMRTIWCSLLNSAAFFSKASDRSG